MSAWFPKADSVPSRGASVVSILFFPFLSLPPGLDFDGFRHKLMTRGFEAFCYFGF